MRMMVLGLSLILGLWDLSSYHAKVRASRAAETFGFSYWGGKGSHRVYTQEGIMEILNFQDMKGRAKRSKSGSFLR